MGVHAVFAVLGLVPSLVLVVLDRRHALDRTSATVLGAAGWLSSGARETIDCDDRPSFCEDRYGD